MPMKPSAGGLQGLIEKAAPTLAATAGLFRYFPRVAKCLYLSASKYTYSCSGSPFAMLWHVRV